MLREESSDDRIRNPQPPHGTGVLPPPTDGPLPSAGFRFRFPDFPPRATPSGARTASYHHRQHRTATEPVFRVCVCSITGAACAGPAAQVPTRKQQVLDSVGGPAGTAHARPSSQSRTPPSRARGFLGLINLSQYRATVVVGHRHSLLRHSCRRRRRHHHQS